MTQEKNLDFQIIFRPSSGDLETMQIIEFYRHGDIDVDEAFDMFFQKIGYTDPPGKAPAIFKKRMEELYRKSPEEEAEIASIGKKRPNEGGSSTAGPPKKKAKTDK